MQKIKVHVPFMTFVPSKRDEELDYFFVKIYQMIWSFLPREGVNLKPKSILTFVIWWHHSQTRNMTVITCGLGSLFVLFEVIIKGKKCTHHDSSRTFIFTLILCALGEKRIIRRQAFSFSLAILQPYLGKGDKNPL